MIKIAIFLAALALVQADGPVSVPDPNCPWFNHHLLPHESDCTKFYYCEWGRRYIEPRPCALGTEFSYAIQTCTFPFLANCDLSGGAGTSSTAASTTGGSSTTGFPSSTTLNTTTAAPSSTTTNTPPTTTPPSSTGGSSTTGFPSSTTLNTTTAAPSSTTTNTPPTTTPPSSTGGSSTTGFPSSTTLNTTTAAPSSTTTNTQPTTTQPPISTTTNTPTTSRQPSSTTVSTTSSSGGTTPTSTTTWTEDCEYLDNGCPADFHIPKLLPHETYCRKFYTCVHGEKVLTNCARYLVFNPEIESCDYAWNTTRDCSGEEWSPEVEDEPPGPPEEIILLPNGCPANFSISFYLPHETYCNRYYQCIFGGKFDRICGPNTWFYAPLQTCVHRGDIICSLPGGDDVPTTTTAAPTTTTKAPTDLLPNGCPRDFNLHWLLPHEDCTKFYYCLFGGLLETACPAGLHFNPVAQFCDSPGLAGCASNPCNNSVLGFQPGCN